jgi:hypothetical protein
MRPTTFLISALCLLILANVLMMSYASPVFKATGEGFVGYMNTKGSSQIKKEAFKNYSGSPAAAKGAYQPIGAFDAIKLETGNSVSDWRYTSPNEPLKGPQGELGPDNMFLFKNNQCKPECCGSSFSCDGGCVCTTPDQRNFINARGGNRTGGSDF